MYGLPEDFNPTGFIGRTVEIVSFTANTLHLGFDGGYSLTVESSFEHGHEGHGAQTLRFGVPVTDSGLMSLVGRSVVAAKAEKPGTLYLRFADGQAFRCFDDSEEYESYRVNCGRTEIIV